MPEIDSFQLSGRSLVDSLSKTERDQQDNFIVVVKIKVDRNGYVVGAEYSLNESTTRDSRLISAAVRAATKLRFNKDAKAPVIANGTITYHFEPDEIRMYEEREPKVEEERKRQDAGIDINSNISNAFGKSSGSSTSEGYTKGSGNQGYVTGDPNSKNRSGSGLGNKGDGFQLTGRSLVGSLPEPQYSNQEDGIVVVKIKVDRNGYVVGAEYSLKGSTTQDSRLINAAIKAAKMAKFNKDPNAPAFVYGTITYHFELD
jgi:TonB family protein